METRGITDNYTKYRWFYTSSGKLVVGGRSAIQNDELLKRLKETGKDFIVMHTHAPGSPFTVIVAEKIKIKSQDIEETAIFTGCFSRAWREAKKTTIVDIFSLSQLAKARHMKPGTWGVKGVIEQRTVSLELALVKQKDILRAVPEITLKKKKDILFKIQPGKTDKAAMALKLQVELPHDLNQEELLTALPAGGFTILR